jgi:superfamily II DNA helicase RecQ
MIPEDGKSFRSELLQLKNKFIAKLNRNAKKLVCTATCTFKTFEEIKETTGIMPSRVMWGPMTKRNVYFRFQVTGQGRKSSIKLILKDFLSLHPELQVLIFTNHSEQAISSLFPVAQDVVKDLVGDEVLSSDQSEVFTLTGDEGNMMKDTVMRAFAEGDSCKIVVATEVAKAGISSSFCGLVLRVGMAGNESSNEQERGRPGRIFIPGLYPAYHILQNVSDTVRFAIRIERSKSTKKQKENEWETYLQFLRKMLCTIECDHLSMEKMFSCPEELDGYPWVEVDTHGMRSQPCQNACSSCCGERQSFLLEVKRLVLMEFLKLQAINEKPPTLIQLISIIQNTENIWVKPEKANAVVANALVLQLLALGLIAKEVLVSTHPNSKNPYTVKWLLPKMEDGSAFLLADVERWHGIMFLNE